MAAGGREGVTQAIDTTIRAADWLLKDELDKAMRSFKRKAPDFATACADARIIGELSGGAATKPAVPVTKVTRTLAAGVGGWTAAWRQPLRSLRRAARRKSR